MSQKITHVNTEINPISDLETIKTEIILSDIDLIQKIGKKQKNFKRRRNKNIEK